MRKLLVGFIVFVLLSVFSTTMAVTSTYTITINSASPSSAGCGGNNSGFRYQIYVIPASVTGSYTFSIVNPDGLHYIFLYNNGGFTNNDICANLLVNTSTSTTLTLTAGKSYQLLGMDDAIGYTDAFDVTVDAPAAPPIPKTVVTSNDSDGDGVDNAHDNCINEYNPGQEDGWGGPMGDACDPERYGRAGQNIAGFVQKNGVFDLHGNCLFLADGAARCPILASFDPLTFKPTTKSKDITSANANGWSVWLYFLYTKDGVDVYQVNTYSTNPPQPNTLVDDHLEIHVTGTTWQWYERGGDPHYHGI
jgi:hypothetical protein